MRFLLTDGALACARGTEYEEWAVELTPMLSFAEHLVRSYADASDPQPISLDPKRQLLVTCADGSRCTSVRQCGGSSAYLSAQPVDANYERSFDACDHDGIRKCLSGMPPLFDVVDVDGAQLCESGEVGEAVRCCEDGVALVRVSRCHALDRERAELAMSLADEVMRRGSLPIRVDFRFGEVDAYRVDGTVVSLDCNTVDGGFRAKDGDGVRMYGSVGELLDAEM